MTMRDATPWEQLEIFGNGLYETLRWRVPTMEDLHNMSTFTKANYVTIIAGVVMLIIAIIQAKSKAEAAKRTSHFDALPAPGFPEIEALPNFDWKTTDPIQYRKFKDRYNMTMGMSILEDASDNVDGGLHKKKQKNKNEKKKIQSSDEDNDNDNDNDPNNDLPPALEKISPSELIPMDKTYLDRIAYRKKLLKDHPEIVHKVHILEDGLPDPRLQPAISELYTWVLGTYLPSRYPTMFELKKVEYDTGKTFMLHNKVTNELVSTSVTSGSETALLRALKTLGSQVDEDFLILTPTQPAPEKAEDETYTLSAYINAYPSGFNPASKLGLTLSKIHTPVPGYATTISKSMDRFFRTIPIGRYVMRVNWSVITGAELYAPDAEDTHAHVSDTEADGTTDLALDDPRGWIQDRDLDKTVLRCERQTLHRLPTSKALVFAFHTYEYPLRDIKEKEPDMALKLADAADGLGKGNVPRIEVYKRGKVWGPGVKRYLRS